MRSAVLMHHVSAELFRELARTHGGDAGTALLAAGQRSRHALLIREIVTEAAQHGEAEHAAGLRHAVNTLDAVQRAAPGAASAVLAYPLVGAWAVHCLRRLRSATPDEGDVPLWADLAHLNNVAAAAAIRAGHRVGLDLVMQSGRVSLPGIGQVALSSDARFGVVRFDQDDDGWAVIGLHGSVRIPAPDEQRTAAGLTGSWAPVRRWHLERAGRKVDVVLDDLDPYRDPHHLTAPADRLPEETFDRWGNLLGQAWDLLARHHPERADELGGLPLVLVPLVPIVDGPGVNVSARDAVGVIAMSPPTGAFAFAQSLVHEFAHSKLGALLDLVDLYDLEDGRRFYSPWRADPRPVGGLVQAVYAFVAVAEFWRTHLESGQEPNVPLAHYRLARVRQQLSSTSRTIRTSHTLTPEGERLLGELDHELEGLRRLPLPPRIDALAALVNEHHRLAWRLRNLRVDPDALNALAQGFAAGESPDPALIDRRIYGSASVEYDEQPLDELVRLELGESLILTHGPRQQDGAHPGDVALLRGDHGRAASIFRHQVADGSCSAVDWVGLAMSLTRTSSPDDARVFETTPELIRDLHEFFRRNHAAFIDPEQIAAWLAN